MMHRTRSLLLLLCAPILLTLLPSPALAAERYFVFPVAQLEIEGEDPLPRQLSELGIRIQPWAWSGHGPVIRLDGEGEAFVDTSFEPLLIVRTSVEGVVAGWITLVGSDEKGVTHRFRIPGDLEAVSRVSYLEALAVRFERLKRNAGPGAAWFRHRARAARQEIETLRPAGKPLESTEPELFDANMLGRPGRQGTLEETYDLFTGGRAVAENLQLDRLLAAAGGGEATVALSGLEGVRTRAVDWTKREKVGPEGIDRLFSLVPEDQYALTFPSFSSFLAVLDESRDAGTPLLQATEERAEDARTRERYETQLCVELGELERILGSLLVDSVLITSSDPFFRTGTDLALLFRSRDSEKLQAALGAKLALAASGAGISLGRGTIDGVAYDSAVDPATRRVSAYLARPQSDVVVLTNSTAQLRAIAAVAGGAASLAQAAETAFFRHRYPQGDESETAFLVVPDAAIRKWCGPRWRIASSRRTRAAAALSELHARNIDLLVEGGIPDAGSPVDSSPFSGIVGDTKIFPQGVVSPVYGSLDFLTPIAELSFEKVTAAEAQAYRQWRSGYERNLTFFDPIAARFQVTGDRLGLDLSILPLILGTEYRSLIELSQKAVLPPRGGDPHPEAILHVALALNTEAVRMQQAEGFLGMLPGLGLHPLSWMGDHAALYLDRDPIWEEIQRRRDAGEADDSLLARLPLAITIDVKDSLRLAAFMTSLRAFQEQAAPDMVVWETAEHRGRKYVKLSPARRDDGMGMMGELRIYYATSPRQLVVTLSEDLLRRAIDREIDGAQASEAPGAKPALPVWLGNSLGFRMEKDAATLLETLFADEWRRTWNARSDRNVLILDEWRRMFPDRDPLEVHERVFGTRLLCPGGGSYTFSETWGTHASTVLGCQYERSKTRVEIFSIHGVESLAAGLTFEDDGLRARVEVGRHR